MIRAGERLHARYTVDGRESEEDWPTFQVDGYGLWLWALRGHCDRHGRPGERWERAVELTLAYLRRHGGEPCVDWWKEREGLHAAPLACVRAGFEAWNEDAGLPEPEPRLDASLLVLGLLGQGEPPLAEIEAALVSPGGGVHRNLEDKYYGGGEWPLLTAMLGLEYAGRKPDARAALDWVAVHATPEGELPEQFAGPPARSGHVRSLPGAVGAARRPSPLVARDAPDARGHPGLGKRQMEIEVPT